MPTVSFHMGEDYCSIDLATPSVSSEQIAGAEKRANQIVFENRPVRIRYVSRAEAEKLGLRKLPPAERDELRLIEVADFDLSACGGTHVSASGQIGSIILRKTEKVRQGTRVEFVCGGRAVRMARRDYSALSEAAALFSAQLWDVPEQIRKSVEESKLLRKQKDDALDQLAELMALAALRDSAGDERAEDCGARVFRSRHRLRQIVCAESDASGYAGHRAGGEQCGSPGAGFRADSIADSRAGFRRNARRAG